MVFYLVLSGLASHMFIPMAGFCEMLSRSFFPKDIINLLQKYGVESNLERGGRYFPAGNKSADVLKALLKRVNSLKVDIRCGHRAEKLIVENNSITGIQANGQKFRARHVILATGGKSYPATGSNGEGYELAGSVGHTIKKNQAGTCTPGN